MDTAPASARSTKRAAQGDSRPEINYGARVQRRLKARWFELVPVRRRSLAANKIFVVAVVALLVVAHYLSMTWPRLYEFPQLARPLRLDNPASFGGWLGSIFMTLAAGICFLIYQLRRYRADDYRGQYRIWRPVIAMMLLLSIDSIAGSLDWFGAILDVALADRAPMNGGQWLRIVLCIAGFALTARLLMEMRHSPSAAFWLVLGAIAVSSPLPIRWNFVEPSPLTEAMMLGAAPLVGRAAVFLSMLSFLRTIYRDVQGIDDTLREQIQLQLSRLQRKRANFVDDDGEDLTREGWFRKRRNNEEATEMEPESDAEDESPHEKRRGWFNRSKSNAVEEQPVDTVSDGTPEDEGDASERERPKQSGLGGWLRGKKKPSQESEPDDTSVEEEDTGAQQSRSNSETDNETDVDNIDWSSMSKSERRRMKKLLRRQGKDAA